MITRRQFLRICASTLAVGSSLEMVSAWSAVAEASYREIPVLIYHRVGYTKGHLTVTPERLAADLEALRESGYQTIGLPVFEKFLQDGQIELPKRPLLITFDDGYDDNWEYAFPLLKQYNMTAVFYIITALIGQPERLTAAQIKEMAAAGMFFGSHTISHRALAELPESEIRDELQTSKNILETLLDTDIRTIAYPKGSYNEDTLRIAKEIGYTAGFSTRYGKCSRQGNHYILKRIPVFSFDRDIFTVLVKRGQGDTA